MLGSNTHTLTNSTIYTSNYRTIDVAGQGKPDDVCTLKLDNVVVHRDRSASPLSAGKNSVVEINRLTLDGLGMEIAGRSAAVRDSKLEGTPPSTIRVAAGSQWTADGNVYGVESITVGEKPYTAASFDAYRQATGQDKGSKWGAGKSKKRKKEGGNHKGTKTRGERNTGVVIGFLFRFSSFVSLVPLWFPFPLSLPHPLASLIRRFG